MPHAAIAGAVALAVMSACAPAPTSRPTDSPTNAAIGAPMPLGAAGCQPVSPPGAFAGEVYGTATGGTVWAWFMGAYPPSAGVEHKTLWRLDGPYSRGTPSFSLVGPDERLGRLNWGPALHDASSWNRPGQEFGTGLLFPAAGCWKVHVTLDKLAGDVYVLVR